MTDTTRPEWMASERESRDSLIERFNFGTALNVQWSDRDRVAHFINSEKLRAQIAVLEEEEDAADSSCNLEFADSDVQHYALRRHEWRQAKIAALRKELGA